MKKTLFKQLSVSLVMAAVAFSVVRCGDDEIPAVVYRQIERLGRPAINEGLVLTNDFINAFNSIPPSLDLSETAAPVVAEAATVLGLIRTMALNAGLAPPTVANVAGGFLPDAMRIDTTLTISGTTNDPAYNKFVNDNVSKPIILVGGRKLTDDVVNITLGYLFNTSPADTAANPAYDDKVSYYGTGVAGCTWPGTNPGAPGHHCLNGQSARYGAASFPFLAAAN